MEVSKYVLLSSGQPEYISYGTFSNFLGNCGRNMYLCRKHT